jgi:molecular chaperone GrpE
MDDSLNEMQPIGFRRCSNNNDFIELQYNSYPDRPMVYATGEEFNGPDQEKEEVSAPDSIPSPPGDLQRDYNELNERFLRLAADFENFRRRSARDMDAQVRFAIEGFAVELLEVADNFERALRSEDGKAREGLEQIQKLFRTVLERHGIHPVESVGMKFDPARHEAVVSLPSACEEGTVVEEFTCGYRMHDRVIRCAKVAVAKGKEGV